MKTLKKNSEFRRMKDSSNEDNRRIDEMLKSGWNYCSKSEWRQATRKDEPKVEKKKVEKKEGKKRSKGS